MESSALIEKIKGLFYLDHNTRQEFQNYIDTFEIVLRESGQSKNPKLHQDLEIIFQKTLEWRWVYYSFLVEHQRIETEKGLSKFFERIISLGLLLTNTTSLIQRAQEILEEIRQSSEEFFKITLIRYQLDINKLRDKLTKIETKPIHAFPDHLKPIYKAFPNSQITQNAKKQIKDFKTYLIEAEEGFSRLSQAFQENQNYLGIWQQFLVFGRQYEMAKYFGARLQEPGLPNNGLIKIDQEFQSVLEDRNAVFRLNRAYYAIRGSDIYKDFVTKASASPKLSEGDALLFHGYVRKRLRRKEKLPNVLNVIECGIGNGQFAADFLNALHDLDLKQGLINHDEAVYPRVRYILCDYSQKMLHDAAKNPALQVHLQRVEFERLDGDQSLPQVEEGIFYARFHELFDDLPRAPLVYVDQKGQAYELKTALALPKDTIVRLHDHAQGDVDLLCHLLKKEHWTSKEEQQILEFHHETLAVIRVTCSLSKLDSSQLPQAFAKLIQNSRDMLLPMTLGGVRFVNALIGQLASPYGYIQIFDYGYKYPHEILHQGYYHASQFNRRYGGSLTNDVSFPLISLDAKEKNMSTAIFLQDDLVHLNSNDHAIDSAPFVPHYVGRSLIRHASIEQGMFHVSKLKSYKDIQRISDRFQKENTHRSEKYFHLFIDELKQEGYIPFGLNGHYVKSAKSEVANLALVLDFMVNGIFRIYVGTQDLAWLSVDDKKLFQLVRQLGYRAKHVLESIRHNPYYGAFWVLRINHVSQRN